MLKIGLTGGIGSGKSTVAKMFCELGINIIDADIIARELTTQESPLLPLITEHFGGNILDIHGRLDRELLRKIVFEKPEEKKWLEQLLHPKIREKIIEQIKQVQSSYCIVVIPLLTEADDPIKFLDRICVVDTPKNIQIERTCKRDQITEEQVTAIINQQNSRQKRLAFADDVIVNDGDLETLKAKIKKLHHFYLQLCKH